MRNSIAAPAAIAVKLTKNRCRTGASLRSQLCLAVAELLHSNTERVQYGGRGLGWYDHREGGFLIPKLCLGVAMCGLLLFAADTAPYASVKPVLDAYGTQLPETLKNGGEAGWIAWSRQQNAAIRARLDEGDLDSLVHLLLFGTSFTKHPRIRVDEIGEASKNGLLRSRLLDLLQGLRSPAGNERLAIFRGVLQRKKLDPGNAATGVFVLEQVQRVLRDRLKFAERGSEPGLYRDRGVSLDATIFPNFGVEESLHEMQAGGLLRAGAVARVAVVGPGLDFIDKESGYDYYPLQSLQPAALYDSLVRLKLAKPEALKITVIDMSSRVLDHVRRVRERTRRESYVIQLPRDPAVRWTPEGIRYWRAFGDQAGVPVTPIAPPESLAGLETRAVRLHPEVPLSWEPVGLNVVLERLDLPAPDRFDLVVATNVLIYYDRLEQALALQNIAAMLKPGGFLLTNDELPESPASPLRRAGRLPVRYAEQPGLRDTFLWYAK